MKTIQEKAQETLGKIQKEMKSMETIHLYHLTPKWERLRANELLLNWLLDEERQDEFIGL